MVRCGVQGVRLGLEFRRWGILALRVRISRVRPGPWQGGSLRIGTERFFLSISSEHLFRMVQGQERCSERMLQKLRYPFSVPILNDSPAKVLVSRVQGAGLGFRVKGGKYSQAK